MRLTIRTKLVLLLLSFSIIPATVVAALSFDAFEESSRRSTFESLQGLAEAKAGAINQFMASRKKEVESLAQVLSAEVNELREAEERVQERDHDEEQPPMQELSDAETIENPDAVPGPDEKPPTPEAPKEAVPAPVIQALAEVRRELGQLLGEQAAFEELLVIAPDGRVVASTFTEHEGKTAAPVEYFRRGKAATYVQPVFRSPITHELTMVIATPIRTDSKEELGVLAARLNLKAFFRLITDPTGLGETGETLVGKKLDDRVVFMAPTRHDDDAALQRTVPLSGSSPLVAAIRGDSGFGLTTDYRGKKVLAARAYAPALDWGVVTKLDADEAARPMREVRNRLISSTLLVIVLAVVLGLVVARTITRPLHSLKTATEKISKGQLDVELNIRSRDEIGDLADSFDRMIAAIRFFRARPELEADELTEDDERPGTNEP